MKTAKKILTDYFYTALGSFILAFAISFFLVPCKISTGGVSGVATVFYYLFRIPLSVTTLVINMILFVCGFRTLKKSAILKTVAGIIFLSVFLEVTDYLTIVLNNMGFDFGDDIIISSVFGGILVGVGVGLTVLVDASTGGSDFAAIMLHKLIPHIGIATFILIIDTVVIVTSGFALEDVRIMFYSVISLYISSKVTDYILVQGDFAKSVYIISARSEEICTEIMTKMKRGVTGIYSKGCFKNTENMMLMCIVKSKEIPTLLENVRKYDKSAFTIVSDVREVHGEGFKEIESK